MKIAKNGWIWISGGVILGYFLLTRIIAFFQPYHHDEYKWALAANPAYDLWESIPHPILAESLYRLTGMLAGFDALRVVPILICLATLALLAYYTRRWWGNTAAIAISALYTVTAFSVLGSVQIDIDGAFLPFFALLAYIGYHEWGSAEHKQSKQKYLALLVVSIVLGLFSKLSFVLVPATLALDYALKSEKVLAFIRRPAVIFSTLGAGVLSLIAIFLAWEHVVFVRYVGNFLSIEGRAYGQVAFQSIKALIYLAPIIPLGILLGWRHRKELSFWFLFLVVNVLFYFVIFDFTHRTFDRYLLFFVLPGAVIAGLAFARLFEERVLSKSKFFSLLASSLVVFFAGIHVLFSAPHTVIPLIPKTAFIDAVLAGHWNILLPITGGSGPLGFYLPLDAIVFLWGASAFCAAAFFTLRKRFAATALALVIALSLVHNIFVTFEFLSGTYFGSAPKVVRDLVSDIEKEGGGAPILTYNDIAAYELHEMNRYAARFYPHEEFVATNAEKLRNHEGNYLVVHMPAINPDSAYGRFFAACDVISQRSDGAIRGAYLTCGEEAKALLPK